MVHTLIKANLERKRGVCKIGGGSWEVYENLMKGWIGTGLLKVLILHLYLYL